MSYLDRMDHPAFKREIDNLIATFDDPTEVYFVDGVPHWVSNDRVPPKDVRDLWMFVGLEFNFKKAAEVEADQNRAFIEDYRQRRAEMTDEQKAEEAFERRAAFGPGVEVVNVLTGEKYTT